jgi:predicted transcriptional regulator YheO
MRRCVYIYVLSKLIFGDAQTVYRQNERASANDATSKPYFSIGEAIATLFHPFAEVVLHYLRSDRVVRIWNSCTGRQAEDPSRLNRNNLQQQISYLVRDYSLKVSKPIEYLDKQERVKLVLLVNEAGLFQARNSIMLMAKAMHLSRASVYNLLAEANKQSKVNPRATFGRIKELRPPGRANGNA